MRINYFGAGAWFIRTGMILNESNRGTIYARWSAWRRHVSREVQTFLRADRGENASSRLLNVVQAFREEVGVTLVKLDVILRCRSGLKPDCLADDECYGLGFRLAATF